MIFSIAVFRGYASVGYHYYKFFGVAQLPFDFKCYICDVLAIGLDGALPWSGGGRPQEMERRKVRSGKFKLGRDTGYPIRPVKGNHGLVSLYGPDGRKDTLQRFFISSRLPYLCHT